MFKKKKTLSLDNRIDSIIDLLEDLRYEQSNKKCANCKNNKENIFDNNINDEDEENK